MRRNSFKYTNCKTVVAPFYFWLRNHRNMKTFGVTYRAIDGITVASKWARWRLKSPVARLFTQPFVQVQINENIKAPRHWPLWGEFPAQRASNAENISIRWRRHQLNSYALGSRHSVDGIFSWMKNMVYLENYIIFFIPKGSINNRPALVQRVTHSWLELTR